MSAHLTIKYRITCFLFYFLDSLLMNNISPTFINCNWFGNFHVRDNDDSEIVIYFFYRLGSNNFNIFNNIIGIINNSIIQFCKVSLENFNILELNKLIFHILEGSEFDIYRITNSLHLFFLKYGHVPRSQSGYCFFRMGYSDFSRFDIQSQLVLK